MSEYLTTTEAAKALKITARSVRRKVSALSPKMSDYVRREGNSILIHRDLVAGNLERVEKEEKENTEHQKLTGDTQKLVDILEHQLDIKDKQIEQLTNRIHEQNVIIARSQEQLQQIQAPQSPKEAEGQLTPKKTGTTFILVTLVLMLFISLIFVALS